MKFHPDKCKVVAITNKSLIYLLPFYGYFYCLNDKVLNYENSERDLGVIINSRISWKSQCEWLVQKANQKLGLVRRSCYFIKNSKKRWVLYLSLVCSIF